MSEDLLSVFDVLNADDKSRDALYSEQSECSVGQMQLYLRCMLCIAVLNYTQNNNGVTQVKGHYLYVMTSLLLST